MKETMKGILLVVIIFIAALLLYTLFDVLDVPSQLGIPIQRINWDAAGLFCGNLVVVALFAITYHALDKRSIQKAQNQRRVALHMIKATLSCCNSQIELLKNDRFKSSLLSNLNSENNLEENPLFQMMLTLPFENHETIVSFAADGVISDEEFTTYHLVKTTYYAFIRGIITFQENDEMKDATEHALSTVLEIAEAVLAA